jgi:hypothetical protein
MGSEYEFRGLPQMNSLDEIVKIEGEECLITCPTCAIKVKFALRLFLEGLDFRTTNCGNCRGYLFAPDEVAPC